MSLNDHDELDVAIFIDIESRDGEICNFVRERLAERGLIAKCFPLSNEKQIYQSKHVKLAIINKPHFFQFHRIFQKLKGTKFVVLDTEGVLPGLNRQSVLFEPEGYVHWFRHQADRYQFKYTRTVVVGYPRFPFLSKNDLLKRSKNLVSVATNFSALGYSMGELLKRQRDRKLKLVNDWSLLEYQKFQEKALELLCQVFKDNADKHFLVKPHPNDPRDLWAKIKLPPNVELIGDDVPIRNLFSRNPEAHLCLDGCTTILDSFVSGIPVITFGRFPPLDKSLLKFLVSKEIGCSSNLELETRNQNIVKTRNEIYDEVIVDAFLKEIQGFKLNEMIDMIELILRKKAKIKFHDFPNRFHYTYWFKNIVKNILSYKPVPTDRKKFSSQ
jgi:hypothetical protein